VQEKRYGLHRIQIKRLKLLLKDSDCFLNEAELEFRNYFKLFNYIEFLVQIHNQA